MNLTIAKLAAAIREGRPVGVFDVQRIVARYSDRMLAYRGKVVARTEALTALSYSQNEAMLQLIDGGSLTQSQIKKRWRGRKPRPCCRACPRARRRACGPPASARPSSSARKRS